MATPPEASPYVLTATRNGVTTLTMNRPKKLNGWTRPMLEALHAAFRDALADDSTKAVVLTGTDPYYCAGVNLGGTLQLGHPKTLRAMIIEQNQALFDLFLDFHKPIIAAINGPAVGAAAPTARLCDAIIASEHATFSTPFAALGVAPEGCSSVTFPRLMGDAAAERMLGAEGWKPTAAEAAEVGLVERVVPHAELLDAAQAEAEARIANGTPRNFRDPAELAELKAVNARESIAVADSFLSSPFLANQFRFLWSKKKRGPAAMFLALRLSRPLWARLL